MEKKTGQLFFIDGKFMEKVRIGDKIQYWDEKLIDITDEIKNALKD